MIRQLEAEIAERKPRPERQATPRSAANLGS
jgi:hypothetical protein